MSEEDTAETNDGVSVDLQVGYGQGLDVNLHHDQHHGCHREEDGEDHQGPVELEPEIFPQHLFAPPGLLEVPGEDHPEPRTAQPGAEHEHAVQPEEEV